MAATNSKQLAGSGTTDAPVPLPDELPKFSTQ
jgi:hypothetical protein